MAVRQQRKNRVVISAESPSRDTRLERHVEGSSESVTRRAAVIAVIGIVACAPAVFAVDILWDTANVTATVPPVWPTAILVLLTAAGGVVASRCPLSRREVLAIYVILMVAMPVGAHTVLFYVLPKVVWYYEMARVNPQWESVFMRQIPWWFAPSSEAARQSFFTGGVQTPWSQWVLPLAAWLSVVVCLFTSAFCLLSLLQRRWINEERLSFPLAEIPLAVVRAQGTGPDGGARLPAWSSSFWVAVMLSFALTFLNALSSVVPSVPSIPLGPKVILPWARTGPLAGLGQLDLVLWPWLLAVTYIIPKELSFSCWFFWIVRLGLTVLAISYGAQPMLPESWYHGEFPAPYHQACGAALALGLWALWSARLHLRRLLRSALNRPGGSSDAEEPLPYRLAIGGFVISTTWLVVFFLLAGARLHVALAITTVTVALYVVWARVRAETGLMPATLGAGLLQTLLGGSGRMRVREVILLLTMRWAYFPGPAYTLNSTSNHALEGFKIGSAAGIGLRRLALLMLAGFVLSLGLSTVIMLSGIYRFGYLGTEAGTARFWPAWQSRYDGQTIFNLIITPTPLDTGGLTGITVGAAVLILLQTMRLRFWWWPFHPVGYIFAFGWGMSWYIVPFFVGWATKTLVTRYGGLRLHQRTLPFVVGLVIGDMLNATLWSMLSLMTRGAISYYRI